MSCLTEERIQQWVDHELDEVARRSASAHIETCTDCRRRVDEIIALVDAAERLPRSIEPPRDLWPEIEARMSTSSASHRFRISWPQLAAAAAVLALGILIGLRMQSEWQAPAVEPRVEATVAGGPSNADPDYLALAGEVRALRRQVEALVAERGARLDQPTLAAVNETLSTLQNADREITQAIEENPDSRHLRAMRTSAVTREAHVLADLMVTLNGASMVGIEPTT